MEQLYFYKVLIPLKKNSKVPASDWGSQKKTDVLTIDQSKNKGFVCGELNDTIIIDVDNYKNPMMASTFMERHNLHSAKFIVKTPGGGFHCYFKYTAEISKTKHCPFVDVQSNGSYCVFP